jgi:uncharacterized protein YehS (DUF1456 family)
MKTNFKNRINNNTIEKKLAITFDLKIKDVQNDTQNRVNQIFEQQEEVNPITEELAKIF